MALSPNVSGAGLGLLAFAAYSAYDATAKVLGAQYHPVQIVAAAGLMMLPLLVLAFRLDGGRSLRPVRPGLMALRCLGTVVNFVASVTAFTLMPLAEAYVIFFTMPLMIAVLAVPFLGERIDPLRGLAVLAGLGGVILALDPRATSLGWGHALAALAALVGAMNYVILRKTGGVERTALILALPMLALFAVTAALTPLVWRPMDGRALALAALMAAALMAGLLAVIAAYRRAPAIVVAPMQYSQIAWAALLGALVFGEEMGPRTLAGSLVIAAAGVVVVARQGRPPKAPAAA